MADVFKLQGKIEIDNSDANEKIEDTTEKAEDLGEKLKGAGEEADGMSGKIGEKSGFSTAAVFMGTLLADLALKAADLATNLAKTGIGFAADMEQNLGGVETLFGSAAEIVYKNADNAYKTAGMSANDYMQTITSFAAALKQSVGSEAEAANVADMAVIDMSDNANKMGTSMQSIMDAYQGFAKQNYTMLDNLKLGYGGTQEEMKRLLEDASKLAGTEFDMASLSDVFSAIHVIQEELGITGTTAQEASTTLSGSAASAKAAWENFLSDAFLQAIPKLTEAINKIMEWMEKNPDKVQEFSDAITDFASASFENVSGFLEWMLENGDDVILIIEGLAAALAIGAIAAHPYAAAIMAVVAGLAALSANNADGDAYNHFFDKYTDDDLATLQRYVDAVNETRELYAQLEQNPFDEDAGKRLQAAEEAKAAALEEAAAIDGLISTYNAWRSGQAENVGKDIFLDVPLRVKDGAENDVQGELNGFSLEAIVNMVPDYSQIQTAGAVTGVYTAGVDGSHASGLGRVPHDGYIARLHKDEAVLTSSQADIWRGGGMMGGTGRLEGMMSQLLGVMNQVANNTRGGAQVVLDSGVLVGQLAPQMDTQLGTINTRKGRRN